MGKTLQSHGRAQQKHQGAKRQVSTKDGQNGTQAHMRRSPFSMEHHIEQHWTASSATAENIFIVCYDDDEQPAIEGALRHYVRLRFRTRKHSQLDYYPGHQVNAGNDVSHVLGYCMDSIAV